MAACSVRCTGVVVTCVLCYALVCIPLVVGLLGVWEPRRQGFFCGDESISLPYAKDTVSLNMMLGVSLGGAVLVACAEVLFAKKRGLKPSAIVISSLSCAGALLFVMAAAMSATFCMKLSMGNLRPHFLAVCQVNATFTCTSGTYVIDDVCTGDADVIRNARQSFPSGHAALAACLTVFVVLYLQDRIRNKSFVVLRIMMQSGLVMGGLYVMGSRVADHQHRLADVIGGAAIGAAFGIGGLFVTKEIGKTRQHTGSEVRLRTGREDTYEVSELSKM